MHFAQEYLGEFVDELKQFFPTELIKSCMVLRQQQTHMDPYVDGEGFFGQEIFLGVDIARMGGDESTFEIFDKREDIWDRRHEGGRRDKIEDVRDRREDVRDRGENILDRREDFRDRRENVRDRRENIIDRHEDIRDRGLHKGYERGVRDHGAGVGSGKGQGGMHRGGGAPRGR